MKKKRYLITTADERTWRFDRPVIFLGEWCRIYDRKHIWENMDAVVAEPYGLGLNKKDTDHAEACALKEKLFPGFYRLLNEYHGTNHDERFWRIVLGYWFERSINMLMNRVNTLELCLQTHKVSGTTFYNNDCYSLATLDSHSAIWAYNDDRWNNALTHHIISLLEIVDISIDYIEEESSVDAELGGLFKVLDNRKSSFNKFLEYSHSAYNIISKFFVRDNDAFIINSYLPLKEEIKLQLALGQFPQIWRAKALNIIDKPNQVERKILTEKFKKFASTKLEKIVTSLFYEIIPVCYLEGWINLNKIIYQLPWPKSPSFIFTSNNFDTNEIFKIWTATKVNNGTKYYAGQHGSNYGTHRYFNPTIEEITSNKFITWGWVDGLQQHKPAFCFKTAGRKSINNNPKGGLLLIELSLGGRTTITDNTAEYIHYFNDQTNFIKRLNAKPRENLTIRLHAGYRYTLWNDKARWNDLDPMLKIDPCAEHIHKLILDNRLIVYSYDSTGILECLNLNLPTLAFWQNGFDHLRNSAKPYYQLLVDAGIVHFSADSVAKKVNTIWDDVDYWWNSSQVQEARMTFCERYAKASKNPVREIKQILISE